MYHFAFAVHTYVRLHSKIPLIALAGLMHLRIPFLLLVLRGTRSIDDRGINNGSTHHLYAVLFQIDIHNPKQFVPQIVLLHQMTELADCRLVRNGLPAQINAHEMAHGEGIIQ